MSFGDFEMGFVVDGNSGNQIHNIQVEKFHSSKNFLYYVMIFLLQETIKISASNNLPNI